MFLFTISAAEMLARAGEVSTAPATKFANTKVKLIATNFRNICSSFLN
jgi:hypothetical protein